MNADFGDVSIIVSARDAEKIWDKIKDIDEKDAAQDEVIGTKVDKVEGMGLSQNSYTNTEKTKLESIEAGAEVNVQSDWDETNESVDEYIKGKPYALTSTEIQDIVDALS